MTARVPSSSMKTGRYPDREGWSNGFTLLELTVVIAILAILSSMTAAAVLAGRKKARNIQCIANLRQHGIALNRFLSDNSAYPMFVSLDPNQNTDHGKVWWQSLYPNAFESYIRYTGDLGVLDCPAVNRPSTYPKNAGFSDYGYNRRGLVASTNQLALGLGGDGMGANSSPISPNRESEVLALSRMIALGDGLVGWNGAIRDGSWELGRNIPMFEGLNSRMSPAQQSECTPRANQRHRGNANIVFCDGHVDGLTLNRLFSDTSDAALALWNRDGLPHRERLAP